MLYKIHLDNNLFKYMGFPRWRSKESSCQCRDASRHGFNAWVGKIPWRRKWQLTSVFLSGKFHGQRSLASYLVHGATESQT